MASLSGIPSLTGIPDDAFSCILSYHLVDSQSDDDFALAACNKKVCGLVEGHILSVRLGYTRAEKIVGIIDQIRQPIVDDTGRNNIPPNRIVARLIQANKPLISRRHLGMGTNPFREPHCTGTDSLVLPNGMLVYQGYSPSSDNNMLRLQIFNPNFESEAVCDVGTFGNGQRHASKLWSCQLQDENGGRPMTYIVSHLIFAMGALTGSEMLCFTYDPDREGESLRHEYSSNFNQIWANLPHALALEKDGMVYEIFFSGPGNNENPDKIIRRYDIRHPNNIIAQRNLRELNRVNQERSPLENMMDVSGEFLLVVAFGSILVFDRNTLQEIQQRNADAILPRLMKNLCVSPIGGTFVVSGKLGPVRKPDLHVMSVDAAGQINYGYCIEATEGQEFYDSAVAVRFAENKLCVMVVNTHRPNWTKSIRVYDIGLQDATLLKKFPVRLSHRNYRKLSTRGVALTGEGLLLCISRDDVPKEIQRFLLI